jgi:chitin disaccharide deacetylase
MTDETISLLVRADDIGMAHAANEACIEVFDNGICRSVELMPTCPWFAEAAQLLRERPRYDVGVHLTLTSEWEHMKWGPLTNAPSLIGDDGYFYRTFWKGSQGEKTFKDADWQLGEVEGELRAQIEKVLAQVPQTSHLSGHMGLAQVDPRIGELYGQLAGEYGLAVDMTGVERFRGFGEGSGALSSAEKEAELLQNLEELGPGEWLFVEHPGRDVPEMRALGHAGYWSVAKDRHGVTRAWTSDRVKQLIERRGIRLISYADIKAGEN